MVRKAIRLARFSPFIFPKQIMIDRIKYSRRTGSETPKASSSLYVPFFDPSTAIPSHRPSLFPPISRPVSSPPPWQRSSSRATSVYLPIPASRLPSSCTPVESNIIAPALRAIRRSADPSPAALQRLVLPADRHGVCTMPQHPLVPQSRPEPDMRPRRDPDAAMGTPVPAARTRADHAAHAPISSRACRRSACSQAVEVVPALFHVAVFLFFTGLFFTGLVDFLFSVDATIGPAILRHPYASLAAFTSCSRSSRTSAPIVHIQ